MYLINNNSKFNFHQTFTFITNKYTNNLICSLIIQIKILKILLKWINHWYYLISMTKLSTIYIILQTKI